MVEVHIKANSRYPIRRKSIKFLIQKTLESFHVYQAAVVEIEIVGDRKMRQLKREHLGIDETTDVLSFPLQENFLSRQPKETTVPGANLAAASEKIKFVEYPDGKLHLGSIIVCYPQAQRQANTHKLRIDQEVNQLIEHGMLHLLGIHHA